jgi:hypothetical protein
MVAEDFFSKGENKSGHTLPPRFQRMPRSRINVK